MMKKFWADESGATAVEYGLILSALSIVIAIAVGSVGETIRDALYGKISDALAL
ncbi:Flp family type IVb pilin [Parvibaculum sp.]|uniref:Flp family type IVb pilin n=1 Tax=Parvibaculum sp. TaxID=2024848 RepID=UPI0027240F43|nr:Flp family type IVb pilin [Parvibaculum sp.]MDO9126969.1 Flp family type IVb pilin [Parvibaculum sp.]MDP1625620.1 Flp family type IVb pilin [Parvibaculum sp.]MDP2148983.1 Flp family type IVb pilin [Parvibaculum sp.]MDP3328601.1 Flp family type IVb pilin [Parvibaculum sp.]